MSSDILSYFSGLDELIQIIYQGAYRFVVLSSVDDQKWTIHLGLSGSEGRWWRGAWTKEDILGLIGSKPSAILLEAFAERLAEAIIKGEVFIGDWSVERGAAIKLTLGPTSKRPLHVPLIEITSEEAASHATDIFLDIALQAQSRQCRLHGSSYPTATATAPSTAASDTVEPAIHKQKTALSISSSAKRSIPAVESITASEKKAQEEIRALKAELAKQQKRHSTPPDDHASGSKPSVIKRPLKGASLANPNKKARKYQAIEFESDQE